MLLGKHDSLRDDIDAEAMEVLNELNLLSESGERQDFKNEHSEWKKGKIKQYYLCIDFFILLNRFSKWRT